MFRRESHRVINFSTLAKLAQSHARKLIISGKKNCNLLKRNVKHHQIAETLEFKQILVFVSYINHKLQ